jgi:hypothetical protein
MEQVMTSIPRSRVKRTIYEVYMICISLWREGRILRWQAGAVVDVAVQSSTTQSHHACQD